MWIVSTTSEFDRYHKRLDQQDRRRVDAAIRDMVASLDPASMGKYERHLGVLAYEIGRRLRITYIVCHDANRIVFISVGDHKAVYGRD